MKPSYDLEEWKKTFDERLPTKDTVRFKIMGEPVAKARPRFARAGKHVRTYTPEKTVNYETLVAVEYRRQCKDFRFGDRDMLGMRVDAYFGIPKSTSKKRTRLMIAKKIRPIKRPDWDNVGKIIADALNDIAYRDDSQMVDSLISKYYSDVPRVEVTIYKIKEGKE